MVDHLASQGSLTYGQRNSLLYAVNAGSNTVSVFSVHGDQLTLRQVVSSGGTFPVSVAVHGNLVYVLNAENGGTVQGYVAVFGHLFPLPGSNRHLGLNPSAIAAIHQHSRTGSLLAGRLPADRHHQGQRQRHRRVPCRASSGGCRPPRW